MMLFMIAKGSAPISGAKVFAIMKGLVLAAVQSHGESAGLFYGGLLESFQSHDH